MRSQADLVGSSSNPFCAVERDSGLF